MMKKSLRVLFVEDGEQNQPLVCRELATAGYRVEAYAVHTLTALDTALSAQEWDLLVSDYRLSGFTCLDVIAAAHSVRVDLPIIVLSSSVGEESAVEVMRSGAHDFILKERIERLVPAIERELAEMDIHRERNLAQLQLAESEERFRQLTESIEETFLLIELETMTVLYVSPSFEQLIEHPCEWVVGKSVSCLLDMVHPDDYARIQSQLSNVGWINFNEEFRILRLSGEERWIHVRHFPVSDNSHGVTRIASIVQDVTERQRWMGEMKTMIRALEQTADVVMITDSEGIIEYVNPAFENITGFSRNEVLGRKPNILKSGLQDERFYARLWEVLISGLPFNDIMINRRKDGELYYEAKTITPVSDSHGEITHYVATGKDITQRILRQERLQTVVNYDAVTGLASRTLLLDRLGQALLEAQRRASRVGVLHIELGLAQILKGEMDRALSERLLQQVAARLQAVMAHTTTLARTGHDEFICMERIYDSINELEGLAETIATTLSTPVTCEGYQLFVTPVIGISLFPDDAEEAEVLLENAAEAMRYARQSAHQPYQFFKQLKGARKGRQAN